MQRLLSFFWVSRNIFHNSSTQHKQALQLTTAAENNINCTDDAEDFATEVAMWFVSKTKNGVSCKHSASSHCKGHGFTSWQHRINLTILNSIQILAINVQIHTTPCILLDVFS